MNKYMLTENQKVTLDKHGNEKTVRQVKALKDFTTSTRDSVSAGEFGGWIESEINLSQKGTSWLDEDSYAFDNSLIEGNAYVEKSKLFDFTCVSGESNIYESILYDSTIVTGQSEVEKSKIYGQSVLGGYCSVGQSKLTNVQVNTGNLEDKKTWNSYFFENTVLKTDEFMIEVRKGLTCKDVHLSGSRIVFEEQANLEFVTGKNIRDFIVNQSTEMYCVQLKENMSIMTSGDKKNQTALVGIKSNPEDEGIVLDTSILVLSGVTIRDNVQIYGAWEIENSTLLDSVVLKNAGVLSIELVNSLLSEMAQIAGHPKHSFYEQLEVVMQADNLKEIL